ncbi:lactosylceramide 1,3-N-acetyl-beta-D-glucosaminyltransferase-like isoform X2 [Sabethes cyaneus]|uniref:lactosylceramide 1,3-N-acetyl-beta-D-glucosaminyltransferase-like isoform X2 n=1 Tax=Sabethes cyaneus TaxID=53552 RepID=UPI00237ECEE9|nr:lactosylceramide 1,3-N-acetyl-beta-D-glucosaminyltransferase-like isoform X2 [Sabethes cyaneus]
MIGSYLKRKMNHMHFRITHLVFGIVILATIIFYSTLNSRQFEIEATRYYDLTANSSEKNLLSQSANTTINTLIQNKLRLRKCGFITFFTNGCGSHKNLSNMFQTLGGFSFLRNESAIKSEIPRNNIQRIVKLSGPMESKPEIIRKQQNPMLNHSTFSKSAVNNVETVIEGVVKTTDIYERGHMNDSGSIKNICPNNGSDINLLILITSAPTHREQRLSIRQSWGHYGIRRDISIGFILGRTQDQRIEDQLSAENYMYSDLIRGNFVDSYKNLTLKTISLLEWTSANCPNATYLLKTDDDMFINVPKLLQFIETHLSHKRSIFGRLAKKWKPIRNKKSKYYVSPEQYFPPVFPPFTTVLPQSRETKSGKLFSRHRMFYVGLRNVDVSLRENIGNSHPSHFSCNIYVNYW